MTEKLYIPVSLLLSALILSGTVFIVGNQISNQLAQGLVIAGTVANEQSPVNGLQDNLQDSELNEPQVEVDLKQLADEGPSIGSVDAPVTIIEFTDFSCPFCAAAGGHNEKVINYLQTNNPSWVAPVPQIIEQYVNTGKVRFSIKYFPGHGSGEEAHKVGWCTYEQNADAFWEFAGMAFENQEEANDLEKMSDYAVQAGADAETLKACLDSGKYDSRAQADTSLGRSMGVSGTPFFFINSVDNTLVGAHSFENFKEVIDAALAG